MPRSTLDSNFLAFNQPPIGHGRQQVKLIAGCASSIRPAYNTTFFFLQRSFMVRTLSVEKIRAAITTMIVKKTAI